MASYVDFAKVYNVFMRDAPYEQWMEWLLHRFGNLAKMTAADLGCGTGTFTIQLARQGVLELFGVDLSEEMLAEAAQASLSQRVAVQWFCQDLREFKLPHPVDFMVSTSDSLNYILSSKDLSQTIGRVRDNLAAHGWFAFDLVGPRRFEAMREGLWYDVEPDAAVLFETSTDPNGRIVYEVHAFHLEQEPLYRRFDEQHIQQYYSAAEVGQILQEQGFRIEELSGDFGQSDVEQANRLTAVVQKVD